MNQKKPFPYRIVSLVLLGWAAIVFPRMLVSPLLPTIEAEFSVSHAQAALLMSSYILPYAIMQLPAGSLSDRFRNRPFLILAMLGTSLGSLLISLTSTFNQVFLIRILAGALSGLWFASSTNIINQYVDSSQRGQAIGAAFSGGPIATIFIFVIVGALSESEMGWRSIFLIGSLPGFLGLALTSYTKDLQERGEWKEKEDNVSRAIILTYLRSRSVALVLTANFLFSLAFWALSFFLPTYFVLDRELLVSAASYIMIIQAVPSILTSLLGGAMVDRFGFRLPVIVSLITMCMIPLFIPLSPLGMPMWIILFVWGLIGGWPHIAFIVLITKAIPEKRSATILGIYNQVGFISATVGPPLFGLVIDVAGFNSFFTLSLAFCIASLLIGLLIRERQHE